MRMQKGYESSILLETEKLGKLSWRGTRGRHSKKGCCFQNKTTHTISLHRERYALGNLACTVTLSMNSLAKYCC